MPRSLLPATFHSLRERPAISASARWEALNFADLLYECWEEEYILFNPASGDTHVLNEVAFELLRDLAQTPADTDTLVRKYLDTPDLAHLLIAHLKQLETIGLVCRKPLP